MHPIPRTPFRSPFSRDNGSGTGAFTFVEMLVAMSLSAMFIGTAALAMHAVSQNSKHYSTISTIPIGEATKQNFYGLAGSSIKVPSAPNLGRLPLVMEMREAFQEDLDRSESVYCLARSEVNTIRPQQISYPDADDASNLPNLDTPEAFRQLLATAEPTSASLFQAYRNVPPESASNTSIFLIAPTDQPDSLKVHAVYDIDYVPSASPEGVYAAVRRYKNGNLTHYYDVFFRKGDHSPLRPTFAAFETRSRLSVDEGDAIDRFKVAHRGPFYLIWWPDPSLNPFDQPDATLPAGTDDPRAAYGLNAGKTGFVLVAPMFPSL